MRKINDDVASQGTQQLEVDDGGRGYGAADEEKPAVVQLATDKDDGDNCYEGKGRAGRKEGKELRDASGRNVVDKMTLSRKLQNIKFLVPVPPTTSNNNTQK
ncbi:GM16151 [Drosophila sechellia]|uniref:GM16151 n=1 Tax=Drosophila sechellia TaxID=7238 RepID=B4IIH8_DROSE|nr:GM16151 [Drosophila sechellia]